MKTAEHKALDALCEAQFNALKEITRIVFTPRITLAQVRKRVAIVLQKLDSR